MTTMIDQFFKILRNIFDIVKGDKKLKKDPLIKRWWKIFAEFLELSKK